MSAALPLAVDLLVDTLAGMPGAEAVVLGGSRANGSHRDTSDWDLAVAYRGQIDTRALERFGTVHPPGSWGRLMNGGAWLEIEGVKVDVLLRDLDAIEHWAARARRGEYEVDTLLGYLAGAPTYMLLAERAIGIVLRGRLPELDTRFPEPLAETAPARWSFHRDFSLAHARMRAERGDAVGAAGQAAKATIEAAHAIACVQRRWELNEKRLIETAGLQRMQPLFATAPDDLVAWVEAIGRELAPA